MAFFLSWYVLILIVFLVLSAVLFLGGFVDADAGFDGDSDGAGGPSPFTVAAVTFMGIVFGIVGYTLESANLNAQWIPLVTLPIAGVVGFGLYYAIYRTFAASEGDSTVKGQELVGLKAMVTIAISPGRDGQVVVHHDKSGRLLLAAQSDKKIPHDASVVITERVGSTVIVRSLRTLRGEDDDGDE